MIQRNAIHSWTLLRPRPEIILIGNEEGMEKVTEEFNLRHVTGVERNDFGTPLLNSIFSTAEKASSNNLLCYINADIILLNDFMPAIQSALAFKSDCLMIGQRWNLDIADPIDFSLNWEDALKESAKKRGRLEIPNGIDYFVFQKGGFSNIKPFALGRGIWDNWLVSQARLKKVPVIDLTDMVTVVHQNHGYLIGVKGKIGIPKGDEVKRNIQLANGFTFAFTTWDADYKLTPKGVLRRSFLCRFHGDLVKSSLKYPILKPMARMVRVVREGFRVLWYGFRKRSK